MGSGSINTKAWANAPVRQRAPIIEQLAAELQKTGGSVNATAHGVVYKADTHTPWDMSREWHGRELTSYDVRPTHWSKTTVVRFYVELNDTPQRRHAFALHLKTAITQDEIEQIAQVFLQVLNMRRVE